MKTVILCGGLGTRLREETEFKPKPMVNIGKFPILWHIMKYYTCFNHYEFIICLGYKGDLIKEFFYNYEFINSDVNITLGNPRKIEYLQKHYEDNWSITLANTGEKSLKGSRLKKVEKYIDSDNFMLTYGDGLSDVNINDLVKFHLEHGKIATLTGINPTSRFGELKINGNQVNSFSEKPDNYSSYINGGYFIFNKKIFDYLSDDDSCDLEYGALEELSKKGELMVYKHKGNWACMDTLRDTEFLNDLWKNKQAFWKKW